MSEQQLFDNAVKDYLESCSTIKLSQNIRLGIPEFEIRFGISNPVSKTDYDNVVRELFRNKWSSKNIDGSQLLRISTEFYDTNIAQRNLDEDEYLEIAKEYSTPKSSIFINGILDNLVKEFEKDKRLTKSGRGLL
jgi:transcription termination factor NusB